MKGFIGTSLVSEKKKHSMTDAVVQFIIDAGPIKRQIEYSCCILRFKQGIRLYRPQLNFWRKWNIMALEDRRLRG